MAELWLAYIELEATVDQNRAFDKIKSLSGKVLASFEKHNHISRYILVIIEMYCRIGPKQQDISKT